MIFTRILYPDSKLGTYNHLTNYYEQLFFMQSYHENHGSHGTALLIYRLLKKKLDMNKTHFTVENIIETLQNMEVANLEDICYMSTYTCAQICTALNAVFDLKLDKKYYQPKESKKKIKEISE